MLLLSQCNNWRPGASPLGQKPALPRRSIDVRFAPKVPPGMWLELRGAISSDVRLSDCRFAFKQLLGREDESLGSSLVGFWRGVRYLSTPFLVASITRQDPSVDR